MSYRGSENFTFTIADYLIRNGHRVTVYSAYTGRLKQDFERLGIRVVSDLRILKEHDFDIAHVHHHVNAYEIRHYFPHLPMVLLCHGIIFLENPPALDLKISQYLATSERVRNCMVAKGVSKERILIFRNMVDRDKFYPRSTIAPQPKRALIVSNKIDHNSENTIRKACEMLKISSTFVGERFKEVDYRQMPQLLNETDIVFSLGRGVIEAMFCGRIPVVFDVEGGDGMVTPSTIAQNMTCNFSGNLHNARYNVDELISVLQGYNPNNALELLNMSHEYFAADKQVHDLIAIYRKHLNSDIEVLTSGNKEILASIVYSISETRAYSSYHQSTLQPPQGIRHFASRAIQRVNRLLSQEV